MDNHKTNKKLLQQNYLQKIIDNTTRLFITL